MNVRILVVEDHTLVREGLLLALRSLDTAGAAVEVLGAKDADAATRLLDADAAIDLLLLDLMLPGTSGMAYLGIIRKRFAHIPVVILSALDDAPTVRRVMRQGAAGFISKASPTETLLEALREVLAGEIWLPSEYRTMHYRARRTTSVVERFALTKSQAVVLELLVAGQSNREIGESLGVTEGTVKSHVSVILKAMQVSNRHQAILIARGKKPGASGTGSHGLGGDMATVAMNGPAEAE